MVKKCVYCSREIALDSVIDVCQTCGHGVWGPKMFATIVQNMTSAKKSGSLDQGSVTNS